MVNETGEQLGVVSVQEALAQAETAGQDLVEIAPNAKPPVVKIIDWGKYRYQQTKLEQKARKKHKVQDIKQVRMGLKIGTHDLDVKLRKMRGFLEDGDIVKVSVMFKGREITHPELGHELLHRIALSVEDIAALDQPAQLLGRYLSISLRKK